MKKKSTYLYLFIALILAIFISNKVIISKTKSQIYSNLNEIPTQEYGLVLGTSKMTASGINPYFKYRMDAVISLYEAGKIKKIIVSGDNSTTTYNETQDMANYLIARGVPANLIIEDYAGFRTLDSVVRAKKVFNCSSVTIISQEFHNQRALYIANYYNMDAVAFNAKDISSKRNFTHIREYLAKCLMLFDLYLFKTNPKFL